MPTSERIRPDFQPGKEVLGAAKTAVLGTVAIWGIFLAIHFIGGADSDAFWGAFMLFGVLGPLSAVFFSTRALIRKRKYFRQGVDIGHYIPMFVHRTGFSSLSEKGTTYIVILESMEELIFFSCEASLCKRRSEDFFDDLQKEVARIPIRDIEDVFVIPAEIDEKKRMSTQVSEFLVNQTLGRLLHRSTHTMFFDAFIVVVLAGPSKRHLVFGVPNKFSGAPIFSTLLHFAPQEVATTFEVLGTGSEAVEALTVETDDPQAIKNAKQIAIEILGIQARLRARNQGLT